MIFEQCFIYISCFITSGMNEILVTISLIVLAFKMGSSLELVAKKDALN